MKFFRIAGLFLLLVMTAPFIMGAGSCTDSDKQVMILMGSVAREVGCEVAYSEDAELKLTIENIWESVRAGTLTEGAIAQLSKYVDTRPTLVYLVQDLVEIAGVSFDDTGSVIPGEFEVTPEIMDRIESKYVQGFDTCEAWVTSDNRWNINERLENKHLGLVR